MRTHLLALVTLAAIVPVSTLTSAGQKFQEPTREELQMTSDPKAPGAPAVYLYREEKTDNGAHYVSSYARIKVLTELGKERATIEVPYVPGVTAVPIIEGRTIHSDGTVVSLTGKAEDLLVVKNDKQHFKEAVFTLPSVEVGSVLEYKWTIPLTGGKVSGIRDEAEEGYYSSALASSIPVWDVQTDLYVHKEHFYYNPLGDLERNVVGNQITHYTDGELASYLLFSSRLPAGVKLQASPNKDYSLDVQDVPASPHESNAPPESNLRYGVRFYYTPYVSADTYWDNEQKRWSKSLDDNAATTGTIRTAASEATSGADTAEAKARKLYDFVQSIENTNFTRAKSEAERKQLRLKRELKRAEDILSEKSGSGNDLAALYLALARAAGLEAYGVKVADRDESIFDPNYLSLSQLDSLLVLLRIDGKDVYVDPGEKLCPFGQLHWKHTLAGGLAQNAKGPVYTPPNQSKDAITAHTVDLIVDAQGAISGTVKILMSGPEALYWRQLNLLTDPDEMSRQFSESLHQLLPQGISIELGKFQGMETSAGYLSATAKVSGQLGVPTGKRMVLPAFFFSQGARPQFVADEKRESAVDLHYAEQVIDDAVYHLPPGLTVEGAPQPAQLPWPDHAALVVKTQPGTGTIELKHIFARAFVLLDAKEYPALHDYYQKVAATDQQQLVLAPGAATGGN